MAVYSTLPWSRYLPTEARLCPSTRLRVYILILCNAFFTSTISQFQEAVIPFHYKSDTSGDQEDKENKEDKEDKEDKGDDLYQEFCEMV